MNSSEQHAPVRVLFIAGTGRSGTTVLSNVLGQVPGCFAPGEIRYVWERGVLHDHRCGCGRFFSDCPVWTSVMNAASLRAVLPDATAFVDRLERRLRVRRVPAMVWRWLRHQPVLPPRPQDAAIQRIYQALSQVADADIIVDSSKLPPYGMLLESLPGLELFVVHMVRDPRATAFSWRRTKAMNDTGSPDIMPRLETWRSAVLWLLWNSLAEVWWGGAMKRHLLVRYEDLVQEPEVTVRRILRLVGLELPNGLIDDHAVSLAPTHSVAGNPNRHQAGLVNLHSDDEWRTAMKGSERAFVTALTAPGLRRFGYSLDGHLRTERRPSG